MLDLFENDANLNKSRIALNWRVGCVVCKVYDRSGSVGGEFWYETC